MRKSFTRLFGFLLLNVMMLFTFGLYAQEAQSTVELYAGTVEKCYNVNNSYSAKVSVKDFIAIKSFALTLNFDETEFEYEGFANANVALGGTMTTTLDAPNGKVTFLWSSETPVSFADNVITDFFDVKLKVIDVPGNYSVDQKFDTNLDWDASSLFYYGTTTSTDQVRTTVATNGSLTVPVAYTAITYTTTPADCSGGQAIINITSPTGLYYYFNGSTTSSTTGTASVSAPSTNTVIIRDANGCSSHAFTIPVTAPQAFSFNGATTENAACKGGNGEIQFSATGGVAPYTYWVVPAASVTTFQGQLVTQGGDLTKPYFTPFKFANFQALVKAGTYSVSVTEGNGCVDLTDPLNWETVTITEPGSTVTFTASTTSVTCHDATDGTITVSSVSGGTASPVGSYTVSIDGGATWTTVTTSKTFSSLAPGSYTVAVKDYNDCSVSKVVAIAQPNLITFDLSYLDASCATGTTTTGSITVSNIAGGAGGTYTLTVQNITTGATMTPTTGTGTLTVTDLAPAYYKAWVSDANCSTGFQNQDGSGNNIPIMKPTALAIGYSTGSGNEVTCNGGSYTLTIDPSGGVAPYTLSVVASTGETTTGTSLYFASVTAGITVTATVTDKNGCTLVKPTTIDVPTVVDLALTSVATPTCTTGTDGRIVVSAGTTGQGAPYSYSTDNWATSFTNNVMYVGTGTYTISVKDKTGCADPTPLVVFVPSVGTTSITATQSETICYGATNATIVVTHPSWPAGRVQEYFYSTVSASEVFVSGTKFDPAGTTTPTTFAANTYYVGARDEYGCTAGPVTVVISTYPEFKIASASSTPATCPGLNNGTLTVNISGGRPYSATPLQQFKYAIVNNASAINYLEDDDFIWWSGTYSNTTKTGSLTVSALKGTYYVVLRDLCNTENTVFGGPYTVDGYDAITMTGGTVTSTGITCSDAVDGTVTVPVSKVSGGKPAKVAGSSYIYTLMKPVGGTVSNTTGSFTGLAAGTYTVTIADETNCSVLTRTIAVATKAALVIADVDVTNFSCKDAHNGKIAVGISGGTKPYKFAVNASVDHTGNDIKSTDWITLGGTATSVTYNATEVGVYYLYVKDANGCTGGVVSVTVTEPAVLTPVVGTVTDVTCAGGNDGSVKITVTGGWGSTISPTVAQYLYTVGTATSVTGDFTGLAAGTYTVTVKDTTIPVVAGTGSTTTYPTIACEYKTSVTIGQPFEWAYTATPQMVKCKGDANGSLTVNVLAGKAATVTTTGSEYYVQLTGSATPTLTTTDWKRTTNQTYTFTGLAHGHYSVWLSNADNAIVSGSGVCILPTGTETPTDAVYHKVASWEVNEPSETLSATVTWNNDVVCKGESNGKFTVTASGGIAGYKYAAKLSTYPTYTTPPVAADYQDSNVFMKAAGTYVIWVKDANGCIVGGEQPLLDKYRVRILDANTITVTTSVTATPSCYGSSNGKVSVAVDGGAGQPYTWTLVGTSINGLAVNQSGTFTGTGSFVIDNLPAVRTGTSGATSTITLTVKDKNGCAKAVNLPSTLNQPAELDVKIALANGAFVCPGDVNGTINAVVTGGTAPYTYNLYKDGSLYTAVPVDNPLFLVQVGHTWKVEVIDAKSCSDSDTKIIDQPKPVVATLKETTCYGDGKASVVVSATGQEGRQFAVRYRLNTTATYGAWSSYFDSSIAVGNLEFANVTETENFYYFQVKDDQGCMTEETKKAFVPTQHPLQATYANTNDLNGSVTISGGITPYTYQIGTAAAVTLPAAGDVFQVVNLKAGQTTITVTDAHGCFVAQSVTVSPVTVTAEPATGINQVNAFDVKLTFNRDVTGVASATTVTSGTATSTFTVTGSGKVYTVSIMADDLATVVLTLANTISDAASNTLTTTTFTYKIGDHVAPTVIVTPPATPVTTVFNIGLKFSEPVSGVLAGTGVTVSGGKIEDVTGMGSTYTVTVSAKEQTAVTVTLTNVIADLSANVNKFAGQTLSYTTGDFTKPQLVSFAPSNDVVTIDNHPTFTMTFDENVVVGTGSLKVYKVATTTPVLTIPVTAAMVSGKTVTVTYAATQQGLDKDSRYYVLVDAGALKDNAGNTIDGVVDPAAWTFKTGNKLATPVLEPVNGSLKVYPNPFVDYVNVVTTSQLSKVVVTNIAGQVVKEVVNPTNTIQLSGLRSGVYFISMYNRDTVIGTAKIVKR